MTRRLRVPAVDALASGEIPIVTRLPRPVHLVQVRATTGFEDFYRDHHRSVQRALALTLRDAQLASEAADEAMARAFARWATVQRLDNPAGWVYRVGLNWSRSVLRRGRGPQRVLYHRDDEAPSARDEDLHRALSKLDIERRAVVVCRYFLGMSEEEIATALSIRPGTVKSRLHRGLRQLHGSLYQSHRGAS